MSLPVKIVFPRALSYKYYAEVLQKSNHIKKLVFCLFSPHGGPCACTRCWHLTFQLQTQERSPAKKYSGHGAAGEYC